MRKAAAKTFPAWQDVLKTGIEDCKLPYDARRAVFEVQPIADYYFAGVVGLEAAKIRILYGPEDATELLAILAEQVDAVAGRTDRLVSDLVFDIISQLEMLGPDQHKLPHDEVIRLILERLGLRTTLEARHLLNDLLFRHHLAEPLACNVPQWWVPFRAKFALIREGAAAMTVVARLATSATPLHRRVARRLV